MPGQSTPEAGMRHKHAQQVRAPANHCWRQRMRTLSPQVSSCTQLQPPMAATHLITELQKCSAAPCIGMRSTAVLSGECQLTIAMDGEVLIAAGQQCKLPDQLLRELLGAVHIVAARGDHRQPVRVHVGLGNHLCACFGCRVGVGGLQRAVLCKACASKTHT